MSKLEQLRNIIDTALQGAGKSKLTQEVIDSVGGFISPNNRHLLNNLGAISTHYLECGSHVGSSLISTVYGNDNLKSATGIDNFSLFDEGHNAKKDFLSHCERHISGRYTLLEQDYFSVTKKEISNPIDLYFFDGEHNYESQRKGISYFAQFLADEAIVVVDDAAWVEPNAGTIKGLFESGLTVEYLTLLDSGRRSDCGEHGFWNGIFIILVSKK